MDDLGKPDQELGAWSAGTAEPVVDGTLRHPERRGDIFGSTGPLQSLRDPRWCPQTALGASSRKDLLRYGWFELRATC